MKRHHLRTAFIFLTSWSRILTLGAVCSWGRRFPHSLFFFCVFLKRTPSPVNLPPKAPCILFPMQTISRSLLPSHPLPPEKKGRKPFNLSHLLVHFVLQLHFKVLRNKPQVANHAQIDSLLIFFSDFGSSKLDRIQFVLTSKPRLIRGSVLKSMSSLPRRFSLVNQINLSSNFVEMEY